MKRFKNKKLRDPRKKKQKVKKEGKSEAWWRNQALIEWEREQIEKAYKEYRKRRKKLSPSERKDWLLKNTIPDVGEGNTKWNLKRFRDKNGELIFQPSLPKEKRPLAKRLPNGDVSVEDKIFNPASMAGFNEKTKTWGEDAKWKYEALMSILKLFGIEKRVWYLAPETKVVSDDTPKWTDKQTKLLRRSMVLSVSKKSAKRLRGTKMQDALRKKYSDRDFMIAWYRIKEERKEFPYNPNLSLTTWGELLKNPIFKLYGIYIPRPVIKRAS